MVSGSDCWRAAAPFGILRQFCSQRYIVGQIVGDQALQADLRQKAHSSARDRQGISLRRKDNRRRAHKESVAGGGAAVVREGV